MCEWLHIYDCILKGLVDTLSFDGPGAVKFVETIMGVKRPESGLNFMFDRPKRNGFLTAWKQTWIGSGNFPKVTASALLLLLLGVKIRSLMYIFGMGGKFSGRQQSQNLRTGFLLTIFWYPLGVSAVYFGEALAWMMKPDYSALNTMFNEALFGSVTAILVALTGVGGLFVIVPLAIFALSFVAFTMVFAAQQIMVNVYLWGMPYAIALYYSGIPMVDEMAKEVAERFVPLVLMPVPPMVILKVGTMFLIGEHPILGHLATFAMVLPAVLMAMMLVAAWKMFTEGAPLASKAIAGSASVIGGAAVFGVTGNLYAGAQVARGRAMRGVALGHEVRDSDEAVFPRISGVLNGRNEPEQATLSDYNDEESRRRDWIGNKVGNMQDSIFGGK